MRLIYKAKWVIIIIFALTFAASFAVLFVGGTAEVNRWLLAANVLSKSKCKNLRYMK